MRMLIAWILGTPLVSCNFGFKRIVRVLRRDGDGVPYVNIFGAVEYNNRFRDFKPIINCTSKDLSLLPPKITGGE